MTREELVAAFSAKATAVNAVVQEMPTMAAALQYVVDVCADKAPAELLADEPGTEQGPLGPNKVPTRVKRVVAAPELNDEDFAQLSKACEEKGFICLRQGLRNYLAGIDVGLSTAVLGIAGSGTCLVNTDNEDALNEAYEWLLQCVQTMEPEIVTDEIIDNMAQGRKALGLIYSGDATYVMSENEDMGFYMPESGTNLWSDAMVIPKNAENPELAHAFIDYVCTYEASMDNSSYVGYTSPNQEVMDELSGAGGDFEGINAYIPRADNENDEVFKYDEATRKVIADLFSRVKVAASNA